MWTGKDGATNTTRRGFLKQVGKTAALGAGLALLPAQAALARGSQKDGPGAPTHCCRRACKTCPAGQTPYFCTERGVASCCVCASNTLPTCFDSGTGFC